MRAMKKWARENEEALRAVEATKKERAEERADFKARLKKAHRDFDLLKKKHDAIMGGKMPICLKSERDELYEQLQDVKERVNKCYLKQQYYEDALPKGGRFYEPSQEALDQSWDRRG